MTSIQHSVSPKSRFSNRADNYVKYRPGYPGAVFDFIGSELGLHPGHSIVDIGSGTGLFSEAFLERGFNVTGVEPNDEMRRAAESRLAKYPNFVSVNTTGENTGLEDESADVVTIAQTFHWLDAQLTRQECLRILKPGGIVVMAWNRQLQQSNIEKEYTTLREKYRQTPSAGRQIDVQAIHQFFKDGEVNQKTFSNPQRLDFEAMKGLLLSKTYIPLPGDELYDEMITELIALFVRSNESGSVQLNNDTVIYWGRPAAR